jgi:hypothetical protein
MKDATTAPSRELVSHLGWVDFARIGVEDFLNLGIPPTRIKPRVDKLDSKNLCKKRQPKFVVSHSFYIECAVSLDKVT